MSDELVNLWSKWKGQIACNYSQKIWDYKELHRATDPIIRIIKRTGIREGDKVVIMLSNTVAFPITLFSLLTMECNAVLVNGNSTAYELINVMNKVSCKYAIHDFIYNVSRIDEGNVEFELKNQITVANISLRILSISRPKNSIDFALVENGIVLHLTSGTYGTPHYCLRPQSSAVSEAFNYVSSIQIYDRIKVTILPPLSHAFSFGFGLVSSLLTDSCLTLYPYFNVRKLLKDLSQDRGTILTVVPPMIDIIAKHAAADDARNSIPKYFFCAGAHAEEKTSAAFERQCNSTIYQIYGTTETGGIASNYLSGGTKGSVGKPLNNVEVTLANKNAYTNLHPQAGEIIVKSPAMMAGYYGEDVIQNDQWNTGDLGYYNESGELFLIGRKRDIINAGGNKVDPIEVERIILSYGNILDVAVYPGVGGNKVEYVQAAIVPSEGTIDLKELHRYCYAYLSSYKIPTRFHLVQEIPKTASGKTVKKKLPEFPTETLFT